MEAGGGAGAALEVVRGSRASNTAALFSRALSGARRGRVLYAARERLEELPGAGAGAGAGAALHMITLAYPRTASALRAALAGLASWPRAPQLVLLDALEEYAPAAHAACGLVALLLDAAAGCERATGRPCALTVSLTDGPHADATCRLLREHYVQVYDDR